MKNKNLITLIILIAIFAISLVAIYYVNKNGDEKKAIVIVGYLPIYVDLPLFVAKEKGFFKKRGVNVDLRRFESSPDMGTAITNEDIDAVASIATTVALHIQSRDSKVIKLFMVDNVTKENYLSSFVALKTSSIKSVADLKGKKIGGFPGPTAVKFGKAVLEKFNINPEKDVEWIELPANTHLSALEAKTVDALFTYEPTATQAVMEKNAQKILSGAVETYIINPWNAGSWLVNQNFAQKNPDLNKRFVLSIYDALDYMRKNPEEAKSSLLPYTKIKLEVAKNTPNIGFSKLSEMDRVIYQKYADIHTERGLITKHIDVSTMLPSVNYEKIGDSQ